MPTTGKTEKFCDGYIVLRTVYSDEDGYIWDLYQRKDEWEEVDNLISTYQKQFEETSTPEERLAAEDAGNALIKKFYPLFKKYLIVLKSGQINFHNMEQKQFVRLFIQEQHLKTALCRKKVKKEFMETIMNRFNFIVEAYGKQDEEEITEDLHTLFFVLAKRYKPVGKSFCCYVYNSFKFEVARFVKNYQKNPANFHYKMVDLDDYTPTTNDDYDSIDDAICEDSIGIPNQAWISGEACSDLFGDFTKEDRLIFSKYYLQDWNDSQIAELLGIHINTANQKRKAIVNTLCEKLGIDPSEVKRHRKSGLKAVLPISIIR